MKKILLRIWRELPVRLQNIFSKMMRPLFQVFSAGVLIRDGEILLVKSTYQRIHPWGLPGGGLERGESPETAVIRELFEEISFEVEVEKLLFVKTMWTDRVGIYYLCKHVAGEFLPSDEISELGYFRMDNLPDVRPIDVALIREIFEVVEHELA